MLDAHQWASSGQGLKQSRLEPLFRVLRTIGPGGEVSRATYLQVACDAGCDRHRRWRASPWDRWRPMVCDAKQTDDPYRIGRGGRNARGVFAGQWHRTQATGRGSCGIAAGAGERAASNQAGGNASEKAPNAVSARGRARCGHNQRRRKAARREGGRRRSGWGCSQVGGNGPGGSNSCPWPTYGRNRTSTRQGVAVLEFEMRC